LLSEREKERTRRNKIQFHGGATTLCILTFSRTAVSIMTQNIMTFCIMTHNITTFSIMTHNITTFSIAMENATLNNIQHIEIQSRAEYRYAGCSNCAECHYAECH
jgi:hypothetical protein